MWQLHDYNCNLMDRCRQQCCYTCAGMQQGKARKCWAASWPALSMYTAHHVNKHTLLAPGCLLAPDNIITHAHHRYGIGQLVCLAQHALHYLSPVRWGEWMEEGLDTPEVRAERAAALSPAGFQAFIKDRAEGEGSAPEVRCKRFGGLRSLCGMQDGVSARCSAHECSQQAGDVAAAAGVR